MDFLLELVPVPVTDVDRAIAFYADKVGFRLDHDTRIGDKQRFAQLTPRGSGCSIAVGEGMWDLEPGALEGLQLVVADIRAARDLLAGSGVEVGEVQVYDSGGLRPSREGDELDNVGFAPFNDPDGNRWTLQQISARG